jgi:hypothetical protein
MRWENEPFRWLWNEPTQEARAEFESNLAYHQRQEQMVYKIFEHYRTPQLDPSGAFLIFDSWPPGWPPRGRKQDCIPIIFADVY